MVSRENRRFGWWFWRWRVGGVRGRWGRDLRGGVGVGSRFGRSRGGCRASFHLTHSPPHSLLPHHPSTTTQPPPPKSLHIPLHQSPPTQHLPSTPQYYTPSHKRTFIVLRIHPSFYSQSSISLCRVVAGCRWGGRRVWLRLCCSGFEPLARSWQLDSLCIGVLWWGIMLLPKK